MKYGALGGGHHGSRIHGGQLIFKRIAQRLEFRQLPIGPLPGRLRQIQSSSRRSHSACIPRVAA